MSPGVSEMIRSILKLGRARPDLREQRRLQADQRFLFCHILSDSESVSPKPLLQVDEERSVATLCIEL